MNPIKSVGRLASIDSNSTAESESSGSRVKKAINKLEPIHHTRQLHKNSPFTQKKAAPTEKLKITLEEGSNKSFPIPISVELHQAVESKRQNPQGPKPTQHAVLAATHAPVYDELKSVLEGRGKSPPVSTSVELHQAIESKRQNPQGPKPTQHDVLAATHAPVYDELKSVLEKRNKS